MPVSRAIASGNWSNNAIWDNPPVTGNDIIISKNISVTFDISAFTALSLSIEPYGELLFPTTASVKKFTATTFSLMENTRIDLTGGGNTDAGFIQINNNNGSFSAKPTAIFFGQLSSSTRVNNLQTPQLGLEVAQTVLSTDTIVRLRPRSHYTINPNLVSFLTAVDSPQVALLIGPEGLGGPPPPPPLVVKNITAATYDEINKILTLTVDTAVGVEVPVGRPGYLIPDIFSTHVHFRSSSNFAAEGVVFYGCYFSEVNISSPLIFSNGYIYICTANLIKGDNIFVLETRDTGAEIKEIRARQVCLAVTEYPGKIFAKTIGADYTYGFTGNSFVVADTISFTHPRELASRLCIGVCNIQVGGILGGTVRISGSGEATITADYFAVDAFTFDTNYPYEKSRFIFGSPSIVSQYRNRKTVEEWIQFIDSIRDYYNSLTSSASRRGLIWWRNFEGSPLVKGIYGNFATGEFWVSHEELAPLEIDVPASIRKEKEWALERRASFVRVGSSEFNTTGWVWEKHIYPTTSSVRIYSQEQDREAILRHGQMAWEYLPAESNNALSIFAPEGVNEGLWLVNDRYWSVLDEPNVSWVKKKDDGWAEFLTPATSASLPSLRYRIYKQLLASIIGIPAFKWLAKYPNDLILLTYLQGLSSTNVYAAVLLRKADFRKQDTGTTVGGWRASVFLWKFATIDTNNYPTNIFFGYPTLTVLGDDNLAAGETINSFIYINGALERYAYQENLITDWNEDPIPEPALVEVRISNFTVSSAYLYLNQATPLLTVTEEGGTIHNIPLATQTTEYERSLSLKSNSEVNEMFAVNLKAKVVVTGESTRGELTSNQKFAFGAIIVSGRGKVYFWDYMATPPSDPDANLGTAKLVIEVNSTTPTVAEYLPLMFPLGVTIVATKASTDPYIAVWVYSD